MVSVSMRNSRQDKQHDIQERVQHMHEDPPPSPWDEYDAYWDEYQDNLHAESWEYHW